MELPLEEKIARMEELLLWIDSSEGMEAENHKYGEIRADRRSLAVWYYWRKLVNQREGNIYVW